MSIKKKVNMIGNGNIRKSKSAALLIYNNYKNNVERTKYAKTTNEIVNRNNCQFNNKYE